MPRARSPERKKAFELWVKSEGQRALKDIAAELGVSPEQVRKWKHDDAWDQKTQKVTLPNGKGHVTKRKKGGQPGNKNAVGNHGGGPPGNKNNLRHGAYERVMGDLLEPDEAEIFNDEETRLSVEAELRRTLAAINAKEVRLIKRINQIRDMAKGNMIVGSVSKSLLEHKEGAFVLDENGHMIKPEGTVNVSGTRDDMTTTHTISVFDALNKLEAELDRTQGRKIKVLAEIDKLHISRERLDLEKKSLDGQTEQSKLAQAWIAALTGEGAEDGDGEDEGQETD